MNVKLKVLYVVNNSEVNGHQALIAILGNENYTIVTSASIKEAKELYLKGSFDFIIIKILLPDITACTFVKKIRETEKVLSNVYTPVIALSDFANKNLFTLLGFDNLITTNYQQSEIESIINKTLINLPFKVKKTIIIKDEEYWMFGYEENHLSVEYIIPNIELKLLESIYFGKGDYSFAKDTVINAPNLNELILEKCDEIINTEYFNKLISNITTVSRISIYSDKLMKIPEWLINCKKLTHLCLDISNDITEIPPEVFTFTELERLEFRYKTKITVIPDDIKNLSNLQSFSLWNAKLDYISPEFFKLPKLTYLSFTYCYYNQTKEIEDLIRLRSLQHKYYFSSLWNNYMVVTKEVMPEQDIKKVKRKGPFVIICDILVVLLVIILILVFIVNIEQMNIFLYLLLFVIFVVFRTGDW